MPRSGAIKKISDPSGSPSLDRARLVQELLSLGHPKITPDLAARIALEVQKSLERKPPTQINAQSISELVEFKFRELGLMAGPKAKKAKKAPLRPAKPLFDEDFGDNDEVTRPLPESEDMTSTVPGLLNQGQHAPLPTLEKFLKQAQAQAKTPTTQISPPRARFQADAAGLQFWAQNLAASGTGEVGTHNIHRMAEQLAHRVAQVETQFSEGQNPAILEVEFYNSLANQEFFPHFPTLLGAEAHLAYGPHQVWIDLPAGMATADQALLDAKKIWMAGGTVSFALDLKTGEFHWTSATLSDFLHAIETTLLELPESIGLPPMVGIYFSASHPLASEFIDLVLSGKYYPRFQLSLGAGEKPLSRSLVEKIWSQCNSQWFCESTKRAQELPRWGGGPMLRAYETCQLGTLNLAIVASGTEVDWAKLRRIIRSAVHFLDNLFEITEYPLDLIQQRTLQSRKIGLGAMGFADLLAKLGFPYDSPQALTLSEKISRFIYQETQKVSVELAELRGAYPLAHKKGTATPQQRHESLTAVCPTDTLSRLAGVSPGVGPLPSLWAFNSNTDEALKPHPLLEMISRRRQVWSEALAEEFLQKGSVRQCTAAATPLKKLFAHAGELDAAWLLKVQMAWETHFDGGIALPLQSLSDKFWTQSFPDGLSFQAASLRSLNLLQNPVLAAGNAALDAHSDGTHAAKVAADENANLNKSNPATIGPRQRPDRLSAITEQWMSPQGPLWFSLAQDELGPRELMVRWGKAGSSESVQAESMSRLITLLLGCAVAPEAIADELRGLRGPDPFVHQGREILSLPDAMAQILEIYTGAAKDSSNPEAKQNHEVPLLNSHELEEEITEAIDTETLH